MASCCFLIFALVAVVYYPTTGLACESKDNTAITVPPISDVDKKIVLDTHNGFRRGITEGKAVANNEKLPKATNMVDLKWDHELAKTAQELADRCIFDHVIPKVKAFTSVGQNLFMMSSTLASTDCPYKESVESWYNEIKDYNKSQRKPFHFTSETGHFTQVVWAETTHVGCGCSSYKSKSSFYNKIIVCNYGPAGNWVKGEMYKI